MGSSLLLRRPSSLIYSRFFYPPLPRSGGEGDSRGAATGRSEGSTTLIDPDPAALAGGAEGGVDDLLDLPGLAEIRALGRTARDGCQEIGDLHGLQIVEPQLMAGGD